MTCRYYGITRQTFYTWRRRYDELGVAGLRERSRRPLNCPHATDTEVVGKIVHLRQTYHFGPAKIAMYLKRYHDVQISHSGVWRILKRLELNRLASSQRYVRHDKRWKRYEKQQPGHRVQVDVIQTDNGSEFGGAFHWHLLDQGIGHVYIKPRTPRLNGKVERSHRIDAEEFYRLLDGVIIDDAQVFNDRLAEWERFYNYDRPHGALGGQTPYERLRQKTTTAPRQR